MLHLILALDARLNPSRLCRVAILGMNGFKPTQTNAVRKRQAGEDAPLRAGPSAVTILLGTKNKLGNICGEDTEQLLALPQLLLITVLPGAVAQNLDESGAGVTRISS
jgi:hypothetical protein